MGGGGGAPAAPDPVLTAQLQGAENTRAAQQTATLNRFNQNTPYGSLTWKQGGSGASFDQAGYDQAFKTYQTGLQNYYLGQSGAANAGATPSMGGSDQPYVDVGNTGGASGMAMPVAPNRDDFWSNYNPDVWESTVNLDPRVQAMYDQALGMSQSGMDKLAEMPLADPKSSWDFADSRFYDMSKDLEGASGLADQTRGLTSEQVSRLSDLYGTEFNYNGAPAMPTANEATRKAVEDSLYSRYTARLDPRFAQANDDLQSQLAAQGITQGSEAYGRELENFGMTKNDAYSSAMNDATTQSDEAMQRLFNMGLGARQQGVTEANTLRTMPTQEALAASQLNSAAGQELRGLIGADTAQQLARGSIASQDFGMQSSARDQIMKELLAGQGLMQGYMPQFMGQQVGANVGASPYAQSIYNSYAGDMQGYNANAASQNSMMNGIAGLAGSLGSAYLMSSAVPAAAAAGAGIAGISGAATMAPALLAI